MTMTDTYRHYTFQITITNKLLTRTIGAERRSLGVGDTGVDKQLCNPKTTRGDDYNAPISQISFIVAFVAQDDQSA